MKIRNYIFIVAAVLGLSACDFLDKSPKDTISPETYFRTETDMQLFSNSFYNSLLDKEMFEHQSDYYIQRTLSNELRGGSVRTVPNSGGGWSWSVLRKINTLLGNMGNCSDEAVVKKYTGLCRFFRAYFYFEKVKDFGDVPWIDKELGSADPEVYAARDTREFVMRKMLEDIDYAIENLPSDVTPYRVNKWAALALKSQFCLYEGTYRKYHDISFPDDPEAHDYKYYLEQSVAAGDALMTGGKYKLYTTGNPNKDYKAMFESVDANKDEYILAIKFDKALELFNNTTAFSFWASQGSVGVTKKAIDSYLMKDGTRFTDKAGWQELQFKDEIANRDPRLAQSIITPGYSWVGTSKTYNAPRLDETMTGFQPIKFVMNLTPALNEDANRSDRSYNDLPVYRYAEILLNYAEAKAELGTLTQTDLDKTINLIRKRAGMPNLNMETANANPDWYLSSTEYGYTHVTGANKGVILEIRREREVEMAQEGTTRMDDLFRWKEGLCIDQQMYGFYVPGPGEYDLSGDGVADVCFYSGEKPNSKCSIVWEIGKDVYLSGGTKGFIDPQQKVEHKFNEARDYLYPIPINDRSLNHNLTQNPGWVDGLDF
jgi:hypothetical protein